MKLMNNITGEGEEETAAWHWKTRKKETEQMVVLNGARDDREGGVMRATGAGRPGRRSR